MGRCLLRRPEAGNWDAWRGRFFLRQGEFFPLLLFVFTGDLEGFRLSVILHK